MIVKARVYEYMHPVNGKAETGYLLTGIKGKKIPRLKNGFIVGKPKEIEILLTMNESGQIYAHTQTGMLNESEENYQ